MDLKILDTDRFFKDSPDAGDDDCICSRCQKKILEEEVPLRVAVDSELLFAKNEKTGQKSKKEIDLVNGYEFRLCESCQEGIGIRSPNSGSQGFYDQSN